MRRLKTKGFTLIELLTVIAILAIVLLISVPTILGVLDKAKKQAFVDSGINIVKAFEKNNIANDLFDNNGIMPDIGKSIIVNVDDIDYDNKEGIEGNIVVRNDNGKYRYYLNISNGEYAIQNVEYDKASTNNIIKSSEAEESSGFPIITNSYEEKTYNYGTNITKEMILEGISVNDVLDGDITSQVQYTTSGELTNAGDYTITYSIENSLGYISRTSRIIHIKAPLEGDIVIDASWPSVISMDLSISGVTSSNEIEYRCVVGSKDTGWQDTNVCNITGLEAGTSYSVVAYARDKADTTSVKEKTVNISTARLASAESTTTSGTCPTTNQTTTVEATDTYDSAILTGSVSQTYGSTTVSSKASNTTACSAVSSKILYYTYSGTQYSVSATSACTSKSSCISGLSYYGCSRIGWSGCYVSVWSVYGCSKAVSPTTQATCSGTRSGYLTSFQTTPITSEGNAQLSIYNSVYNNWYNLGAVWVVVCSVYDPYERVSSSVWIYPQYATASSLSLDISGLNVYNNGKDYGYYISLQWSYSAVSTVTIYSTSYYGCSVNSYSSSGCYMNTSFWSASGCSGSYCSRNVSVYTTTYSGTVSYPTSCIISYIGSQVNPKQSRY